MVGDAAFDDRNAAFWDELCGTNLAREIGVHDASEASLARFDEAYLALYPYLLGYVPPDAFAGRRRWRSGLATARSASAWHAAAPITTGSTSRPARWR